MKRIAFILLCCLFPVLAEAEVTMVTLNMIDGGRLDCRYLDIADNGKSANCVFNGMETATSFQSVQTIDFHTGQKVITMTRKELFSNIESLRGILASRESLQRDRGIALHRADKARAAINRRVQSERRQREAAALAQFERDFAIAEAEKYTRQNNSVNAKTWEDDENPERKKSSTVYNSETGEELTDNGNGYTGTDGTYYQSVAGGMIDPETGEIISVD